MMSFLSGIVGAIGGGYLGCKLGAKHSFLSQLACGAIGAWGGNKITKAAAADFKNTAQRSAQFLNWVYNTTKRSA